MIITSKYPATPCHLMYSLLPIWNAVAWCIFSPFLLSSTTWFSYISFPLLLSFFLSHLSCFLSSGLSSGGMDFLLLLCLSLLLLGFSLLLYDCGLFPPL